MKQIVKHVTLNNSETLTKIHFDGYRCSKYLVKNFTEGNIYVSFDGTSSLDECIKMPAGYAQEIAVDDSGRLTLDHDGNLYLAGSGEVEIQLLVYSSTLGSLSDSDILTDIEDGVLSISTDKDISSYDIYVDDKLATTLEV